MPLFRLCHGKCLIHTHRLAREFRSFAEASRLSNLASHAAHARYTCMYISHVCRNALLPSFLLSVVHRLHPASFHSLSLFLCVSFHSTLRRSTQLLRIESSRVEWSLGSLFLPAWQKPSRVPFLPSRLLRSRVQRQELQESPI